MAEGELDEFEMEKRDGFDYTNEQLQGEYSKLETCRVHYRIDEGINAAMPEIVGAKYNDIMERDIMISWRIEREQDRRQENEAETSFMTTMMVRP